MKKIIPLTTATKRIKYIGIKLTEKVKDPCTKIYRTLLKEGTKM